MVPLKPNIKNLKIFGQHAAILKTNNKAQFEPKAELLIFVGYTENLHTYRFYNSNTNQVIESSNARFLNEIGPIKPVTKNNLEYYPIPLTSGESTAEPIYEDLTQFFNTSGRSISATNSAIYSNIENLLESSQQTRLTAPLESETQSPALLEQSPTTANEEKQEQIHDNIEMESRATNNHGDYEPAITRKKIVNYKDLLLGKLSGHKAMITIDDENEPQTFEEVMNRSDKTHWLRVMEDEIESLIKNNVYALCPRPNTNIITSRWIYKIKRRLDGQPERYKARLVARGFTQREGIDYHETFAPVSNITSIRLLLAYTAMEGLEMKQFDIKTAFLYGELEEEVS